MSTMRVKRVPKLKTSTKKDEVSSREPAKSSSLPYINEAPKSKKPFFSQDLSLVHIWLEPTNSLLSSRALYPPGEATVKIAVPLEKVQDFLSTLQPAYKSSTVPVVAYTLGPAIPLETTLPEVKVANVSRRLKAKRKRAEADAAPENPDKRAKTAVGAVPAGPAMPKIAFEGPPATVMEPKPPVRVPLGHKAYDRMGKVILMPYLDQIDDLIMPEEAMHMNTDQKSLMRMFKEHEQRKKEKLEAAALKEKEALKAGTSVENANDSEAHDGDPSASTANESVNTTQVLGQSEPVDESGMGTQTPSHPEAQQPPNLQTQARTPGRGGFLGNLMGSVRRFVPGLHRSPVDSATPGVAEASQTNALTVNNNANTNNTSANDAPSNNTTRPAHQPQSSKSTKQQVSSNITSLKVPKPTLVSWDAHQKAKYKKQKKIENKQRSKTARENSIQDEVARRVKQELATLTGTKRKRYSPDRIPNPVGTSYGLDTQFFGSDSESDEEVEEVSKNSPSEHAAKRQRMTQESPYLSTQPVIGDPRRATPYTGTALADPPPKNLFSWRKQMHKYAVPESSSDEHSDGRDKVKSVYKPIVNKGKGKEVQFADKVDFSDEPSNRAAKSKVPGSLPSEPLKSAMKATSKPAASWQMPPPPSPALSHAALPPATPTATPMAAFSTTPTATPMATFDAASTTTHTATPMATFDATSSTTPIGTPRFTFDAAATATPITSFGTTSSTTPIGMPMATFDATATAMSMTAFGTTASTTPIGSPMAKFNAASTTTPASSSMAKFNTTFTATPAATSNQPMPYLTSGIDTFSHMRSQIRRHTPLVPSGFRAARRLSSSSIAIPGDEYTYDQTNDQVQSHTYEQANDDTYDPTGAYDISEYRTLKADEVRIVNGELRPVLGCIPSRAEPECMDQEVRAAVDAIPDDCLANFGFPPNAFRGTPIDPEVQAALDARWNTEDGHRAECIFNDELVNWLAANKKALLFT